MRSSRVAVLDCGASHVAAGVFSRSGGRLRLEQFAWKAFSIASGREEEWHDALLGALGTVAIQLRYRGPVTVVLPGHLVLTKFIKTPRVDAAKREKVIRFEAQQNIPYAMSDVAWDHVVTGESDLDLDVMLCAAKLEAVDALCAAVESAGLQPRVLVPGVLALRAALDSRAATEPTLYANLGARSTTLLLVENRRVHARTLAMGGQHVTQQLVEIQDCDWADAEEWKTSGRNAAVVAPAVESFATRLGQEITRSAVHFKRQSGAASPTRIVLTGGAARAAGLPELLGARANVPVEIFDPLAAVEIQRAAADAGVADVALHLADLVCAAQQQLAGAAPTANLLPPRLRTREDTRRRQPWFAVAAVLVAAAFVAPLLYYREWETALRHKIVAVDAEIAPLRAREARNRANLEQLAALQEQVKALQGIAARRANWQQLFADLQDRFVKVEDVWLERVQLASGAADANAPLRIAVSGRMLDRTNPLANVSPDIYRRVTELLTSVVDSPYVSAVENERFDNRQPGILHFDVVLVAEPARPL
ncbi:MAG: pilus assembly protein PilM [Candidatus Didemnitutus sp.]|nr:pilus assembly protein PilM [Candidatus Didemnitutus sp.]